VVPTAGGPALAKDSLVSVAVAIALAVALL
jgi:hypothetical protein